MNNFKPNGYRLLNVADGRIFDDSGWDLADSQSSVPSLVRAVYNKKKLEVKPDFWGFYRFADWLPVHHLLSGSATTVTYKSEKLAQRLGLDNLYIAFSGYWPEKGAKMSTCSFKETEAYSVCGRLPKDENRILVVASAGNTARAFAKVCSENNIPILISIPYDNLDALWFDKPLNDYVKIISSPAGSDYFDAISLAQVAVKSEKFLDEGGAKNVARRDGMGTTLLSAAVEIGSIPDVYVQAIGSGTGGIAAWEAAMRLAEDGSWGENNMQLLLVQNAPFTPMYDAWNADSRNLLPFDDEQARLKAIEINAKVLSNRRPPYPVSGGVYDALKASSGLMEVADNDDIITYSALFEECEGIDINPAAAIALAGLDKAVRSGKVSKEKCIVLNITGGGEKRFKADNQCFYAKPALVASAGDEGVLDKIIALFE